MVNSLRVESLGFRVKVFLNAFFHQHRVKVYGSGFRVY